MTTLSGPPRNAIRNKPITAQLEQVLISAGQVAGIDAITITSGGQDALGHGTRRTGSTRHDAGRAADIKLIENGRPLSFSDDTADRGVLAFVKAAAAAGATGIGAGVDYMGPETIHVGFGTSPSDHTKLTWGAGGRSVNAPQWLRDAANAGWASPAASGLATSQVLAPGHYVVIARDGLKLRGGPGTSFDPQKTLAAGLELDVVALSEADPAWARVDLEGDGLLDGYVFASFLAPAGTADAALDGEATAETGETG